MDHPYLDKLRQAVRGRLAVYIDAANLERSVQDLWVNPKDIPDRLRRHRDDTLRWRVDYHKLKGFFTTLGQLETIRFYSAHFGSESHNNFLSFLRRVLGFKLETKSLKQYADHTPERPHRKANFDVEIAVDATFSLFTYDTFILFSGDCDFEYLLKFLRGQNKITIVFSRTGHVAKELPPACNYYFDLIDFRHEMLKMEPKIGRRGAKNPA